MSLKARLRVVVVVVVVVVASVVIRMLLLSWRSYGRVTGLVQAGSRSSSGATAACATSVCRSVY